MAKKLFIIISGIIVAFVGIMTLIGYSLGIPSLYQWSGGEDYMAINTAVCFTLVGWSLITIGFMKERE
jgi:hypothetical protein